MSAVGRESNTTTSLRFRGRAARLTFAADASIRWIRIILKYPFQFSTSMPA
jgi:hypothetical protein